MARKSLSLPNDNRSHEGASDTERLSTEGISFINEEKASARTDQLANVKINTTHQGQQQDR